MAAIWPPVHTEACENLGMDPTILRWLSGGGGKLGPALPTPRREASATVCREEEEFSKRATLDSGGFSTTTKVRGHQGRKLAQQQS